MAAITISRQLGSLGDEVAQTVASRLGYRVVCRELINQAAQRAGAPEMALLVIDDLGLLGVRPSSRARRAYQQAIRQVIDEMAVQGNVIVVGRAGCVLLRDRQDVLHVRVIAPVGQRIQRIAQQQSISMEAARAQVEASDRARRNYVRHTHHTDWDDPQLYDLVINMERMPVEAAADLICLAQTRCLPV